MFRLGAFLGLSPSSSHASMGTACQSSRARAQGMPTPTSWTSASLFPHLPHLFLGLLLSSLVFLSASIQIILNTQQRSPFLFCSPPPSCLFSDSTVEWLPIECAQSLQWPGRMPPPRRLPPPVLLRASHTDLLAVGPTCHICPHSSAWKTLSAASHSSLPHTLKIVAEMSLS